MLALPLSQTCIGMKRLHSHSIIISVPQFGYKHRCSGLTHSYRGVFAELTQRGEGLFVGFPDSVNHLLCVWAQCVALCAFLLFIFFLLLIPVIPYRCTDRKTTKISADGFCQVKIHQAVIKWIKVLIELLYYS